MLTYFDNHQLAKAIDQKVMNEGIAKAYEKYAVGQTVIFATSVDHAVNIAEWVEYSITGQHRNNEHQDYKNH